ncbi:hypothetical protein Goarm_004455 [Gossypium armourianum]|uniref:Uncharacterized protein n=1 Tax=Gossypium armourianum TaxID=34283 RepID=A0A7J9JWW1_9ROSI|nr:hypothetical protein [Gossypium armourianum]
MSEILANSKEENSPQAQQQRSKANNMPRANLNVLPPHPWFPVNSKDDSDIGLESDGYFEEQDSEDKKEEEELRLEVFLIGLENENLKKKLRHLRFAIRKMNGSMMTKQKTEGEFCKVGGVKLGIKDMFGVKQGLKQARTR